MDLPADEDGDVRMDVGLVKVEIHNGLKSAEYHSEDYFVVVQSAPKFYRWSVRKNGKPFTSAEEKLLACPAILREGQDAASYTIKAE